ncbi:MAG: beta-lactamase family protein [Flavobacteriales bacterium]|nr:beta-lactamase family protein [Flavobacteriales bacterium]
MKFIRPFLKTILVLFSIILIACISLYLTGNAHLIKAVRSTYLVGKTGPSINDYLKFENRIIAKGNPIPWNLSNQQLKIKDSLITKAKNWETVAFLVSQKNKIIYEKYWDSYSKESLTNSFSMAKTFTGLAIGACIEDGLIKSVNDPVALYLDEFNTPDKKNISIKDLLTMSSGIDFGESYGDPFGFMAKAYYGREIYQLTLSKPQQFKPGKQWKYQGGNTLVLSFIVEKVSGKTLSEYFSEKFWKPIGASEDALWTYAEEDGKERAYCCFYSNARDFAKIGKFLLDSAKINGKSIVDSTFYNQMIKPVNIPDENGKTIDYYGYQIWLGQYKNKSFYYARGILGQYIVVIPELEIVFVRLGHKRDKTRNVEVPKDLYLYFDMVFDLINNK